MAPGACAGTTGAMRFPALAAIPIVLGIVALAACSGDAPRTGSAAASDAGPALLTLDDFESGAAWSLDSADNYAALSPQRSAASDGLLGLQIDYADNGRGKSLVRREVEWDLSGVTALSIDAHLPSAAEVQLALALRGKDGALFETRPQALTPGWNRGLTWTLDAEGFKDGTDLAKWRAAAAQVNRVMVQVIPAKGDGRVAIDRLRAAPAEAVVERRERARIEAHLAPAAPLRRHGLAEIELDALYPADAALVKDPLGEPWLRRMTAAQAQLRAPDGALMTIAGFCTAIEPAEGGVRYRFRFRLAPHLAGEWRYQAGIEAGGRWAWAAPASFVVDEAAAGPGPIRLDPRDPRWFARADGSFFWPLGENVAWSGDYEPYLKAIAAAKGNFLRSWICPWNDSLDVDGRLDVIDFAAAERIDRLFAQAQEHGVAVQLCLQYHGMLGGDWHRNPFNKANGGPCSDPREFWSRWEAKERFRKLLDYCVARWGWSPQLFAWELWNEAELTPRFRDEDVVQWHREMAEHLQRIDVHRHLVTTSTAGAGGLPELWRIQAIDVVQPHLYDPRAPRAMHSVVAQLSAVRKPILIAEWGRGWEPFHDQVDREGRAFRQSLWSAWMLGLPGAPLTWWWDTHVEPNDLLAHLAGPAAFLAGEDPRGRDLRPLTVALPDGAEALCLVGADRAYGYAYHPESVAKPGAAPIASPLPAGRSLRLEGLAPGAYRLELWDVEKAVALPARDLQVGDEGAAIPAPDTRGEFAFKLVRARPLAPAASVP